MPQPRSSGDKKAPPRISGEAVWYAIPVAALIAFFAWVLYEMGSQSAGTTLVRMLVGVAIVLVGSGILLALLSRFGSDDE